MITTLIVILIIWNCLLTLAWLKTFRSMITSTWIYYPYIDTEGLWIKKTYIGACGGGISTRVVKWFWIKDE
jgi:hypothetical protein